VTRHVEPAVGNGRPRTYVACTNPLHRPVEEARRWAKAQPGWDWQELATARRLHGHGAGRCRRHRLGRDIESDPNMLYDSLELMGPLRWRSTNGPTSIE
jgi:hypothetical protein